MKYSLTFTPTPDRNISKEDIHRAIAKAAYKVSKGETRGSIADLHLNEEIGTWELCEIAETIVVKTDGLTDAEKHEIMLRFERATSFNPKSTEAMQLAAVIEAWTEAPGFGTPQQYFDAVC